MSNHPELPTIDPAALAQVSGGISPVPPTNQDPVLTALSSILDSLNSLANQQTNNSGGFNQQEMLMLMMVMQQRNQEAAAAAAAASGGWSSWNQQPIVHFY